MGVLISFPKGIKRFGNFLMGNYSYFEPDGTLVAKGEAITFRDEYPSILIPVSGAAAPDSVAHTIGGVARQLYGFDGGNTQEILSGSFEIPHDYAYGEIIEIHVHYRPSTIGGGNIQWFLDWEYSPSQGLPTPQTTLNVVDIIEANKRYLHKLVSLGVFPNLGFTIGGKIGFNLRRTPSGILDTYGADALLEQIAIHIPIDTLGSRQRYIK